MTRYDCSNVRKLSNYKGSLTNSLLNLTIMTKGFVTRVIASIFVLGSKKSEAKSPPDGGLLTISLSHA